MVLFVVEDYEVKDSDMYSDAEPSTLQSFFRIKAEILKRELRWKGLDIINGKLTRVSDPIAPDHYISALINTISSVIGEHNVLTKISGEETKQLLMEKYTAFVQASLREPFFNWDLFPLVKEEFDHSLQLFISFSKDGWGTKASTSLQAGVVAEQTNLDSDSDPYARLARKMLNKKGKITDVLEEESEKY